MKDHHKMRAWNGNRYEHDCLILYANSYGRMSSSESSGLIKDASDWIFESCTGLKDKNGKLIYEGDIVKNKVCRNTVAIGVYENPHRTDCISCGVYLLETKYNILDAEKHGEFEIIGNIHENPELLEEECK